VSQPTPLPNSRVSDLTARLTTAIADVLAALASTVRAGANTISRTFIKVLERSAAEVKKGRCRLILAAVSEQVKGQLERTETTADTLGEDNIFAATTTLGATSRVIYAQAQEWLEEIRQ